MLAARLKTLKTDSEIVSKMVTRMTVFFTQVDAEKREGEEAMFAEFKRGAESIARLTATILTECSLGIPLRDKLYSTVKCCLHQMGTFLSKISEKDSAAIKVCTGMLWKACEDIGRLPESNKIAYRRQMFLGVAASKETCTEFQEYVAEAEKKLGIGSGLGNESDEDEDDFDDDDYDEDDDEFGKGEAYKQSELPTVQTCVKLMEFSVNMMKQTVAVLTEEAEKEEFGSSKSGQEWVAQCFAIFSGLQSLVVDLGSNLFPPLENGVLRQAYGDLLDRLRELCRAFKERDEPRTSENMTSMEDLAGALANLSWN